MNEFISIKWFDYLLNIANNSRISKTSIEQVLNSIINNEWATFQDKEFKVENKKERSKKAKIDRKSCQVKGIINLIRKLDDYEIILDVGCGSGALTTEIAKKFQAAYILGIDLNNGLIEKNRLKYKEIKNLEFEYRNAFEFNQEKTGKRGLITSLHGCGSLTDKVIDIAIASEFDILCVPCCYLKTDSSKKDIPQSKTLKKRKDFFKNELFPRLNFLEGNVNDGEKTSRYFIREIYRLLLNYDRLFYLSEQGYETNFVRITERYTKKERGGHLNSTLNMAIIGKKISIVKI